MHLFKSAGLAIAAAVVSTWAGAASANVIVGTPGTSGSGFPFSANPGGRYQQVYDSTAITAGAPLNVTSLTFFAPGFSGALASGVYTVSLSTTARGVDGLGDIGNPSNGFTLAQAANSNLGANNTVVFSGALPSVANGRLTFTFGGFLYDPAVGNLLLDVASPASTAASTFFSYDDSGVTLTSRLTSNGGTGFVTVPFGLVTEIGVPEPASMALLGAGLAGFAGLRRRRSV